jgi:hypothetical protein
MPKSKANKIVINLEKVKSGKNAAKRRKVESSEDSSSGSDSDKSYELQFEKKWGDRDEVLEGKALKTKGNLTKESFVKNARGKMVSRAASSKAKENWAKGEPRRKQQFIEKLIDEGYTVIDALGVKCDKLPKVEAPSKAEVAPESMQEDVQKDN